MSIDVKMCIIRDLASQKFLPAETLVDHGARRAKNEKKKSFALRAARKMINITKSNSICINYTAIQGNYTNLSYYL